MKLKAIIEKTSTGFSGYIKEIDGIATAGNTLKEMKSNFQELINEYISSLELKKEDKKK